MVLQIAKVTNNEGIGSPKEGDSGWLWSYKGLWRRLVCTGSRNVGRILMGKVG